jgi:uncharacterized protein (TIGR00369 family)
MSGPSVQELQALLDKSPLGRFLGIVIEGADTEAAALKLTMPMRPEIERMTGTGQYHGGVIGTFIDVAGDFAVAAMIGGAVPTINLRTDYLRPAQGKQLRATAHVRRLGRTIAVVDIDVFDEGGKLVAVGRGTYGTKQG